MIHSNLRRTMVEEKCEIFEGFFFQFLKIFTLQLIQTREENSHEVAI